MGNMNRIMPFVDLVSQQQRIRKDIDDRIRAVLEHGQYIQGPEIRELETKLAGYVGVRRAVACSSGTDALLMALMAHGIGPGDAVFTAPFTFISPAGVIRLLGAVPIFVDIEADTFNIDSAQLERGIIALSDGRTADHPLPQKISATLTARGIIGVDMFGLPANYDRINAIAEKHGLFVIEDAAQSFGAQYGQRKAASLAEVACTSFFPSKPLGCYGDGGMCFSQNDSLAKTIESLRDHGMGDDKYDHIRLGINGRMDSLQATILLAKFEIFQDEIRLRRRVAGRYTDLLSDYPSIQTPVIPEETQSAWAQYSILLPDEHCRDGCRKSLETAGIPTAVYYPIPLHFQRAFADLGYREGDFPVSEGCSLRILSLPMHPYLSVEEQEKVVETLVKGLDGN